MYSTRLVALFLAVVVGVVVWNASRNPAATRCATAVAQESPQSTATNARLARAPSADRSRPPAPTRLPAADPPYHGVAIQVHSAHDVVPRGRQMLREIAALGADTALFGLDGFQKHVESTKIAPDPVRMPTDDEWLELFAQAHDLDLRVVLMPKILLSDPRGNNWRGKIQPTSWDEWFDQYTKFVVRYAQLAERGHVEVYIVGSDLVSTEKYTEQWRRVIGNVRAVYSGRISYSANWDHYRGIQFWNDVDLIGMTSYHKLSDRPGPSLDALRTRWAEIRDRIVEWQRTIRKPILFTEAGWCSQEGCSVEAWNYYRQEKATPAGLQEQRDCYQAFVDTWAHHEAVAGILWWEWSATPGGSHDFSYTPKGKPAEQVLRALYQDVRTARRASAAIDAE